MTDEKIIYSIYGFLLAFDILYKADSIFYIPFGLSLIILCLVLYVYANKRKIIFLKTTTNYLFAAFVMYSIITGFLIQEMVIPVMKNILIFILFFTVVIWLSKYTDTKVKREYFFQYTLRALGFVFIVKFIMNYESINILNQLLNFFNTAGRYRYAFGLGHVNDAGLNAISIFIVTILYNVCVEKKVSFIQKIGLLVINVLALIVLLASSCRNALLSFMLFVCIYILLTTSGKKDNKYIYVIQFGLICFIGGIVIKVLEEHYHASGFWDLMRYSGRMVAFEGIETMFVDNKQWLGYGLSNKSDFLTYASKNNKTFVMDSSYIYYLVHSGIIGFCLVMGILISIFKSLITKKCMDIKYKRLIIASCIMFLFTGLFETTVLYTGMPISLIFSVICMQYVLYGDMNEDKKRK